MKIWRKISEITSGIIPAWGFFSFTGLRSAFKVIGSTFFGNPPLLDNTVIDYDTARLLYLNGNTDNSLGAHFAKPIIDLPVDFIGLPVASTEDENLDDFLNDCLHTYWADVIPQILRNSMRDSKVIVRLRQDPLDDPLMTVEERDHCRLETIEPERVALEFNESNNRVLDRAFITHEVMLRDDDGDLVNGILPRQRVHEIIEEITPKSFRYFDVTDHVEMTEWDSVNSWGFVPLVEVWNEYDTSLSGGQSDLEAAYPFIQAFHDVLYQGLQAHKYHSTPKLKFKLIDVATFIKNNFPDAIDPDTGNIKSQAQISWKGKEIIFTQVDEDVQFIEARSVLGDTQSLLDFLIDCICVASETPKWAFSIVDAGSANQADNAQSLPWLKKIQRKRTKFSNPIQDLLKMVCRVNGFNYNRPKLTWQIIRVEDQAAFNQALQFLIMGLEVAATRGIISDTTYRELLREFVPQMKNPTQEAADAKKNVQPLPAGPANAPASQNGKGNPDSVPVTSGQSQ